MKEIPGKPHEYLGASAGCWELYGQLIAREYGFPQLGHRKSVDVYAVQHPGEPGPQAIQSVNVHLVSLYLVLEKGVPGEKAIQTMRALTHHPDSFVWLEPPVPNGSVTVVDVLGAENYEQHVRWVEAWARDVWQAWRRHHPAVKSIVEKYWR